VIRNDADLYRTATSDHTCPYGLKALDLLKRRGLGVTDHPLKTRAEVEAFKAQHNVSTTPQAFIGGARIGGYEDVRHHLGLMRRAPAGAAYRPALFVFGLSALMAVAAGLALSRPPAIALLVQWFVGFSMCLLALPKLQDVERFSSMFLGYDLLARRWVPYSYVYPFAELIAGALMVSGRVVWVAAPLTLFIGGVGAASVFKAVYLERRQLKCACVGGASEVPLGALSLLENLVMIGMAVWMLAGPTA
jgi:glutaredoxin